MQVFMKKKSFLVEYLVFVYLANIRILHIDNCVLIVSSQKKQQKQHKKTNKTNN